MAQPAIPWPIGHPTPLPRNPNAPTPHDRNHLPTPSSLSLIRSRSDRAIPVAPPPFTIATAAQRPPPQPSFPAPPTLGWFWIGEGANPTSPCTPDPVARRRDDLASTSSSPSPHCPCPTPPDVSPALLPSSPSRARARLRGPRRARPRLTRSGRVRCALTAPCPRTAPAVAPSPCRLRCDHRIPPAPATPLHPRPTPSTLHPATTPARSRRGRRPRGCVRCPRPWVPAVAAARPRPTPLPASPPAAGLAPSRRWSRPRPAPGLAPIGRPCARYE